jgi:hypothetical protein
MLGWFKDAALTLPINGFTPKWVSVPTKGMTKTTSVWLGDAYTSLVSQAVSSIATTIYLTQVDEFSPTGGVVTIDGEQIAYTAASKTPSPNISGLTRGYNSTTAVGHLVGAVVYPQTVYTSVSGNITILVNGMSAANIGLGLAVPSGTYGPSGVPLLLSVNTITSGVAGAIQINLRFAAPANSEQQFRNLSILPTLLNHPADVAELPSSSAFAVQPPCLLYVQQRDQGLVQRMRLLPLNRQVQSNLPGFTWGQYRWRDNTTENSVAVVPTRWDTDTSLIAQEFIGGVGSIGETNDLQPIDLEEQDSSIYLRAQRGQYFTGTKRYYYPSDNWNLEFLPSTVGGSLTYQLQKPPAEQTPVFVGNWRLDGQGFYEYNLNARYTFGPNFNPADTVNPQFTVDRVTGILTINPAVQGPQTTILLGVLSGGVTEYFDLPYYPIDTVIQLYVTGPTVNIPSYTFNREQGFVTFPKASGTSSGQPLFAVVNPAIAVEYEYDVPDETQIENTNIPDEDVLLKDTRLLSPDLNPAFAGLSSGYVYLQHRVLRPVAVQLSADKPQIAIPPTLSSIVGLIAYGPVYYSGDHALLTALAIGSLPNEDIPGAQLQVIPGGYNPANGQPLQTYPFRGLINGLDPNTNTIIVTTGGDGVANLVYQPESDFGFYIPTTAPWITSSFTETPTATPTWSSAPGGNYATVVLNAPLSHEYVVGGNLRLTGFTPATWDGDWQILTVDVATETLTISMPNNPGAATIVGLAGPTDTITLPTPIPISQLWAAPPSNEGWLDYVYPVLSNQALFGLSTLALTGNADIGATLAGHATAQVVNNPPIVLAAGNPVTITNATSPVLDGSWTLTSAVLSAGIWTIQWVEGGSLASTAQVAGTLLATGAIPFLTDGTVSGAASINSTSWTGGIATYNLASVPTNLEIGQNIQITGCTTSTLNGLQNVLTIAGSVITTPTTTAGTGSESESGAMIVYSNFRTNGVLTEWDKIIPNWAAGFAYQVGDSILDSNGNLQVVSVAGTSGGTAPAWGTLFGQATPDGVSTVWINSGQPGPSTAIPIHAYDKNGFDYFDGTFSLTGNASIDGTGLATITVVQSTGDVIITTGDTINVYNATSPSLDGTWAVGTVHLNTPSPGFTTLSYQTNAAILASTPQLTGTLNDTSRGFNGNVVQLVFNQSLPNPSQGFVQAYLFQFLEREIIQMQVVGTNIYSNSIMLQMQAPNQLISNPYLVLSTDQTVGPPYYPTPLTDSVLNQNRLGIITP